MNASSLSLRAWKTRLGWLALVVVVFGLVLVLAAPAAQAADFRSGGNIVIDASTVINDDLFVAGEDIVIDGTIKGDLYALGSTITINGTVEQDVMAAGETVIVNGKVGETLRAGAQNIIVGENAQVARSALLGAMGIETKANSTIGHDLIFGAYQGLLSGTVQNDVVAGAQGIELRGTVGRNMRVSVGDAANAGPSPTMFMPRMRVQLPNVPPGLTIAPSAKIGGDLIYESNQPVKIDSGAQVTGPVVQQTPVPEASENRAPPTPEQIQAEQTKQTTDYFLDAGRNFIILLLLGLLVMWLLPKWIGALADAIQTKPLGSFGRGILMFIGYFVAAILLVVAVLMFAVLFGLLTLGSLAGAVVLVGFVLFGVLTVSYYLFMTFVAPIVVSFLGGRLLLGRMQATWAQNRFVQFIVGLILLSLVLLIPFLNWIIGMLVALFALGALVLWAATRAQKPNAVAVPAA